MDKSNFLYQNLVLSFYCHDITDKSPDFMTTFNIRIEFVIIWTSKFFNDITNLVLSFYCHDITDKSTDFMTTFNIRI